MIEFSEPQKVTLKKTRWHLSITVIDSRGEKHEFLASADSGLTDSDGLFFAGSEEIEELKEEGLYYE